MNVFRPRILSLLGALSLALALLMSAPGSAFAQPGTGGGSPGGEQAAPEQAEPAQAAPDEARQEQAQQEQAQQEQGAQQQPQAQQRPTLAEGSIASQERTMPGGTLALIAYIVLWVLIFGFVFVILRRQKKLDAELDALEARVDKVFEGFDQSV